MESGEVDVAPEYLASLLTFLDPEAEVSSTPSDNVGKLEGPLSDRGMELLDPSEANDTNALVTTSQTANKLALEKVSDLAPVAEDLTFGGPPECRERRFCLPGLEEVYGIEFGEFKPLDAGGPLTVAALASAQIDVALLFTTSGVVSERGWILLEDDKNLQAADNITPLVRTDVTDDDLSSALNELSAVLTTGIVTDLNAAVEVRNEDFRKVARDFLTDSGIL